VKTETRIRAGQIFRGDNPLRDFHVEL